MRCTRCARFAIRRRGYISILRAAEAEAEKIGGRLLFEWGVERMVVHVTPELHGKTSH